MTTLNFYGASDDLFYAGPVGKEDEFYAPYSVMVAGDGGQMVVIADYTDKGVWSIAIAPVDEDIPLPDWPMRVQLHEGGYSTQLFIDAPGKVAIRQLAGEA